MCDYVVKLRFKMSDSPPPIPGMTDKLDFLEGDKKAGKDSSQGPKKVSNKKG